MVVVTISLVKATTVVVVTKFRSQKTREATENCNAFHQRCSIIDEFSGFLRNPLTMVPRFFGAPVSINKEGISSKQGNAVNNGELYLAAWQVLG